MRFMMRSTGDLLIAAHTLNLTFIFSTQSAVQLFNTFLTAVQANGSSSNINRAQAVFITGLCVSGAPPQIQQFPDDMKILAGQEVGLLCKFTGAQPISCTWLKFRKPVRVLSPFNMCRNPDRERNTAECSCLNTQIHINSLTSPY